VRWGVESRRTTDPRWEDSRGEAANTSPLGERDDVGVVETTLDEVLAGIDVARHPADPPDGD
jgi:hypothetical protein